MIKKALHRITVIWCLYGLVRLLMLIDPLLRRLYYHLGWVRADMVKEDQQILPWAITVGLLVGAGVLLISVHFFANWFFNTKSKWS